MAESAAQKHIGADTSGLPWSMRLYGERTLHFTAKQETLQRTWAILCGLHERVRAQDWAGVEVQLMQSLKAVEAATRQGSWRMAWHLTNLPDPCPSAGSPFNGLSHPQEVASAIQIVREQKALEEALR
eukprot:1130217-Amphidinium_carterae.1